MSIPRSKAPSLKGNSVARLVSDVWALLMSLVAATVTARLLGPSGKGFYSTLVLLAAVFMQLFGAGLGEAAVVFGNSGRFPLRRAVGAAMTPILPFSVIGAVAFAVGAGLILRPHTSEDHLAILFGGALVGVMILYIAAGWFLLAQERVVWLAVLATVMATLTTGGLWLFMAVAHLGSAGAVLGTLVAGTTVLIASAVLLHRVNLLPRPGWVRGFLRPAVRFGAQLQLSDLLVTLTGRLDLVLVYRLRDSTTAGSYSVALTIGALVAMVPIVIAYVVYPRLARIDEVEARRITTQAFRLGMVFAAGIAGALALLTPLAVPAIFGSAYRGATVPTLVLLPGGVLMSGQWLLCRAAAARGKPKALSMSFLASFVTMIALDFLLIPSFGAVGAAIGALASSIVGIGISFYYYVRWGWQISSFMPNGSDVDLLMSTMRHARSIVASSTRTGAHHRGRRSRHQ